MKQRPYRSAEALRHPKSGARVDFLSSLLMEADYYRAHSLRAPRAATQIDDHYCGSLPRWTASAEELIVVDRGPEIPETVRLAKEMVDASYAITNHKSQI
jgi:hypothetical protein